MAKVGVGFKDSNELDSFDFAFGQGASAGDGDGVNRKQDCCDSIDGITWAGVVDGTSGGSIFTALQVIKSFKTTVRGISLHKMN